MSISYDEILVEPIVLAVQERLSPNGLACAKSVTGELRTYQGVLADQVSIQFQAKLASHKPMPERLTYEDVPADWWQHLKERWFPARWLRRWPVKTRAIRKSVQWLSVCPHTDACPPTQHYQWMREPPTPSEYVEGVAE